MDNKTVMSYVDHTQLKPTSGWDDIKKLCKETIENHTNIYDFCLRLKLNNPWKAELHTIDPKNLETSIDHLSKTTRYYVSNSGGSLYKRNADDNRFFGVTIGYLVTPFNTYVKKIRNIVFPANSIIIAV